MDWVKAVDGIRAQRIAGVLVTIAAVRGHSPRNAGAKMVVTADTVFGTIGGGNLEAAAIARARKFEDQPHLVAVQLSEKAPGEFGVQCCGGEVTLLYEPLPPPPAVAIFGCGHVGMELARILARREIDLFLIDTRGEMLLPERIESAVGEPVGRLTVRVPSLMPERVLDELPTGTHLVVMTHDHAEDLAICDAALRCPSWGSIGLIGSRAKWARFRTALLSAGLGSRVDDIRCPIGIAEITGKEPSVIAVSVAADLYRML